MKIIKGIILTLWFIVAIGLLSISPFMIDEEILKNMIPLLFLNAGIPLVLILSDDELTNINF